MAPTTGLSCWSSTLPKSRRPWDFSLSPAWAGTDRTRSRAQAMTRTLVIGGLAVVDLAGFALAVTRGVPLRLLSFTFLPKGGASRYPRVHHTPRGQEPPRPDAGGVRRWS